MGKMFRAVGTSVNNANAMEKETMTEPTNAMGGPTIATKYR